ncbi:winged helix-turn-helix transcriptional regulator [Rhizobium sp. BR 314]|uniref:winged helix-turn-helix transcriptional regulator n=1 Tax=Rhizobium sp. BR 314 TaxID=3040013 RepID=UPI0039BF377F
MKPLIIICSPDYEFYLLLAQILNMGGFEAALTEGAEETLAVMRSDNRVVAVMIDYHTDSFPIGDFVDLLAATLSEKALPIAVFVSAGNQPCYLEALKAGVSEIFMRPFNPERFLSYLTGLSSGNSKSENERNLNNTLVYAEIAMQLDSMRVEFKGMEVQLSPIEFRLLHHFLQKPGHVFTRDDLIEAIWPPGTFVEPRTVDVHVGRLRRSLRGALGRDIIRTVRATGYALDDRQRPVEL